MFKAFPVLYFLILNRFQFQWKLHHPQQESLTPFIFLISGSLNQFRKRTSVLALMEFLDRVDTIFWSVELVLGEINRIVRGKLGIGIFSFIVSSCYCGLI
jgi:hypothetical protein